MSFFGKYQKIFLFFIKEREGLKASLFLKTPMASFYERNKVAVIATAAVGLASVAATAYYLSSQVNGASAATDSTVGATDDKSASKKKKKNKKNKKKASSAEGSSTASVAATHTGTYPVDSTGLPNINEDSIKSISKTQKDEWALELKEKGNEYFKDADYENAIVYYSKALICQEDPIFYGNRSACYNALGNFEKTIEDTTKALELDPQYIKCLFRRATAYENVGKFQDALFDITAMTIYGGMADNSNEKMMERVLRKLSVKLDEEVYSKLPKELPSASSMSSFFGAFVKEDIDRNLDSYPEGSATRFIVEALNELELDTQEGYDKANTLFNQAIAQFEKSIEGVDPKIVAIAYEYAGSLEFLKTDTDLAKKYLEKAIEIFPRPRQHVVLGLIGADLGNFQVANDEFEKAISMNPDDPNIYYHFGQIHYLMGALPEAQKYFEKSKELNPKNVYAHIQLACIVYRQGDFAKCEEMFKAAKNAFPTSPEVPNYYGEILFDRKDTVGAIKQFSVAAVLQEKLPTFNVGALPLINKSVVYQMQQNVDKTIEILTQATELDPKSEVARMSLGQMYLSKGDVEGAIKKFDEACKLSRSGEDRKQAISLLEASKMQLRIRNDPVLSAKVQEMMLAAGMAAQN